MKDEVYLKKLGKKIAKLREAKGISQRGMSERLDTSNTHLRRIEAGEVSSSITNLKKIAEELGLTVSELVNI
jgi:transcriptional regulator with XRE-family HTH domain